MSTLKEYMNIHTHNYIYEEKMVIKLLIFLKSHSSTVKSDY